jgi:uncharacterized membrane protein YgcG
MLAGEFLFEKRRLSMWTKPGALLCLLLAMAVAGFAQEHPNPTGYVSDFANLLSPDQARSLNDELIAFEKKDDGGNRRRNSKIAQRTEY